ncbi:MAG: hypothetical protein K2W99_04260 [Chthoniobacterales bacterium]|nr:hypothetical protein [Chthoniobacterales bacterium]
MNPVYNNPTTVPSNYTGADPLENYTPPEPPSRMQPRYFNPTLYDPFPFSFAQQPFYQTYSTLGSGGTIAGTSWANEQTLGSYQSGVYSYLTVVDNSYSVYTHTQTYTYDIIYAPTASGQEVTFGSRFGTGIQTIYFSAPSYTDTIITVEDITVETVDTFSTVVSTYYSPTGSSPWDVIATQAGTALSSTLGVFTSYSTLASSVSTVDTATTFSVESTFIDMLGNNVYQELLGATNSIIIYQNEQVSSYYSESLSYQVNITNLTAALNSVAQTVDGYGTGAGIITVTNFLWTWVFSTGVGWTGSQITTNSGAFVYTFTESASEYLTQTWGTSIQNSSVAVQQVQSLITVEDNSLETAQTFLNNAVTTLQSQVSLAGQIIASLASLSQAIATNIASG